MEEKQSSTQRVRRRASRAAGPANREPDVAPVVDEAEVAEAVDTAEPKVSTVKAKTKAASTTKSPAKKPTKSAKPLTPLRPPPRRPAHRALVAWLSLAAAIVLIGLLSAGVVLLVGQHRHANAARARDQRFVDTASQTVVNMFSYTQDNIDESVNRFVNGTSGPLRGMLSAGENVGNLKALFRRTNSTSEAVINGAALESIDEVSDNGSVLVSVRVTVADMDGVNKPSMPYRLRVIVHEDDTGKMTAYDLKYPDGGN